MPEERNCLDQAKVKVTPSFTPPSTTPMVSTPSLPGPGSQPKSVPCVDPDKGISVTVWWSVDGVPDDFNATFEWFYSDSPGNANPSLKAVDGATWKHEYTQPGEYFVKVVVTVPDPNCPPVEISDSVVVQQCLKCIEKIEIPLPNACFEKGESITFDAVVTPETATLNAYEKFEWSFKNVETGEEEKETSSSLQKTHAFGTAGTYAVTVKAVSLKVGASGQPTVGAGSSALCKEVLSKPLIIQVPLLLELHATYDSSACIGPNNKAIKVKFELVQVLPPGLPAGSILPSLNQLFDEFYWWFGDKENQQDADPDQTTSVPSTEHIYETPAAAGYAAKVTAMPKNYPECKPKSPDTTVVINACESDKCPKITAVQPKEQSYCWDDKAKLVGLHFVAMVDPQGGAGMFQWESTPSKEPQVYAGGTEAYFSFDQQTKYDVTVTFTPAKSGCNSSKQKVVVDLTQPCPPPRETPKTTTGGGGGGGGAKKCSWWDVTCWNFDLCTMLGLLLAAAIVGVLLFIAYTPKSTFLGFESSLWKTGAGILLVPLVSWYTAACGICKAAKYMMLAFIAALIVMIVLLFLGKLPNFEGVIAAAAVLLAAIGSNEIAECNWETEE